MQRACRKRFTPGKDLHMSDFEMLSIILMVLGLVLMGNQKKEITARLQPMAVILTLKKTARE